MKITSVTPLVLGTAWRELLFVKIETDEGITGFGAVRPLNKTEAVIGYLREVAPRYTIDSDGCVCLPSGPGLGVTVDEALIAAHPSKQVHFNLFSRDWHKRDTGKTS